MEPKIGKNEKICEISLSVHRGILKPQLYIRYERATPLVKIRIILLN